MIGEAKNLPLWFYLILDTANLPVGIGSVKVGKLGNQKIFFKASGGHPVTSLAEFSENDDIRSSTRNKFVY